MPLSYERRSRVGFALLTGGAAIAILIHGCGTEAVGVESCRQLEEARCAEGPACGLDLSHPTHRDSPQTDVEACIRFYRDECLHGLVIATDPGPVAVQACVRAIHAGDCSVVQSPELSPSCAFLIPPPPSTSDAAIEASSDAAAAEASAIVEASAPEASRSGTTIFLPFP